MTSNSRNHLPCNHDKITYHATMHTRYAWYMHGKLVDHFACHMHGNLISPMHGICMVKKNTAEPGRARAPARLEPRPGSCKRAHI